MAPENDVQNAFLLELHRLAKGDEAAQHSMYTVGANLGMDRSAAKRTAEDLIGLGFIAVRTLSGGISITAEGAAAARQQGAEADAGNAFRLGTGPWIGEAEADALAAFLESLRQKIPALPKSYSQLEEMVIDLKTMDVQLLSPRPRTAVIQALLKALQNAFEQAGERATAVQIGRAAGI